MTKGGSLPEANPAHPNSTKLTDVERASHLLFPLQTGNRDGRPTPANRPNFPPFPAHPKFQIPKFPFSLPSHRLPLFMSAWFRRETRSAVAGLCINLAMLTDFLCAVAALLSAHYIRFHLLPNASPADPSALVFNLNLGLGAVLFCVLVGLFDGYRRFVLLRYRRSFPIIFKASLAWLLIFPFPTLVFELVPDASRIFILLSAVLLLLYGSLVRFVLHRYLLARGITVAFRQRILFVDWSPRLANLVTEIRKDPWHPYEIVGAVPPKSNRFTKEPDTETPLLGSHSELAHFCENGLVNIVLVADGERKEPEIAEIASLCERNLVTFMVVPTGFQILLSGLQVTTISSVPVLGVTELPLERPANALIKRTVDLLGAAFGLVVSLPIIAVFSALVFAESPGPVFYRQVRVGRNGRQFRILKIRSMGLDAEKETGARWATKEDPRRLRIGAFMRRWNIDELPQFWNVLCGDMSLVGPRPERPELIVDFKETISHYNARHHIIPGLTGWAQVNGLRGDTDLTERIRYDLFYMENWSPALDIQILFMTFFRWDNAA